MPPSFAFDLSWLPAALISIGGLIGGAIYAKQKGLPALVRQADAETNKLVAALQGQLELANIELAQLRPKLASAATRIEYLEAEVDRLEKRLVRLNLRLIAQEDKKT